MQRYFYLIFALSICAWAATAQSTGSVLKGKVICIDPGHGGTALTDHYRVGPGGEREEWVNLRVSIFLKEMLEDRGAKVIMTRMADSVVSLPTRAKMAIDGKADIFVSIHHNATADSSVNFPIIYFHGNACENLASVAFGKLLAKQLVKRLYNGRVTPAGNFVSLVSDFTIFAESGASVLRNTYGQMPAVLAEASFFTHADEEQRLKQTEHNRAEAMAFTAALETFFKNRIPAIKPKNSVVPVIPPFPVFQEAARMTPVAKRWYHDFRDAEQLILKKDTTSQRQAYDLFTRSARSFPDSYVAAHCHRRRSKILKAQGKLSESAQEEQRAKQYYVRVK
jgi:N-acetylmuramoyl-L-alanine amidase